VIIANDNITGSAESLMLCEEMTKILMSGLLVIMMAGCVSVGGPDAAAVKPKPELVFLGTVQSIESSTLPQSLANWVVTFRIDKIESGEFAGKTFSFRIHSPSKSGLENGKQYVVEAIRTDAGYEVDQYQWINKTHNQPFEPTR
jgi:hypothetical protein